MATAHRARAAAAGIEIAVESAAGRPAVDVDPVRMRQVVSNLVDNAIRAMPDGGSIRLTAAERDGALVIEVVDDGPGIDAGAPRHRVRAVQRSPPTSRGSGLGLAIARAIVEAHGGSITAGSGDAAKSSRKGTSIRIVLPSESR